MKCHRNNKDKIGKGNNPIKFMLHMALCCGVPLIIISMLPLVSRLSPRFSVMLAGLAPFICPIMMLLMIPMFLKGSKKGNCCGNEKQDVSESEAKVVE
jgi:hypothetical protein